MIGVHQCYFADMELLFRSKAKNKKLMEKLQKAQEVHADEICRKFNSAQR